MWRKLIKCLVGLMGLVLLVALAVVVLGALSSRPLKQEEPTAVVVYAVSNGVHVSLALPVRHEVYDWTALFDPHHSRQPELAKTKDYVLIGWGSKVFYTQVPTWAELTLPLALKALAYDKAAFNVTYLNQPVAGEYVREIRLTERQYRQLVEGLLFEVPFYKTATGKPTVIPGVHYGATDVFYEANGRYTPWFTCNEWIRRRLDQAEVVVPLWSPFATPIMWHLQQASE
ncbi:MAG: TIGR02117 family protein [Neisseriaceae bacterium]|nr:TIGR02117 family protein [Neisseriaceae bacterium]